MHRAPLCRSEKQKSVFPGRRGYCRRFRPAEGIRRNGQQSAGDDESFGDGITSNMTATMGDSDSALRRTTLRLIQGEHLARADAEQFLAALVDPAATDAQIAAALVALSRKGET